MSRQKNSLLKKRKKLLNAQGRRCFYCNTDDVAMWTDDHVFPASAGYSLMYNFVRSCERCNFIKDNRFPTFDEIERVTRLYESIGWVFNPTPTHYLNVSFKSLFNIFKATGLVYPKWIRANQDMKQRFELEQDVIDLLDKDAIVRLSNLMELT